MCGRFTLRSSSQVLMEHFLVALPGPFMPRYNICPTQSVPIVRQQPHHSQRTWTPMRWGLVPSWAKDLSIGARMINARAETLSEKPSFRSAAKTRRCMVVADGFYEWKKTPDGKQPYYIHMASDKPFAFAGLWEIWPDPNASDQILRTCTIITTEANRFMRPLHDRMPVIVKPEDYDRWIDPALDDFDAVRDILRPADEKLLIAHRVSTRVNRPGYEQPDCVEPLPE